MSDKPIAIVAQVLVPAPVPRLSGASRQKDFVS